MRLIADKSEIDNKLLDTINAFAWDGIGEARKVLYKRVFEIMMYYKEGGTCTLWTSTPDSPFRTRYAVSLDM